MGRSKGSFILAGVLVFTISFGTSWFVFSEFVPLKKLFARSEEVKGGVYKPLINMDTKIRQETIFLCGNKEILSLSPSGLSGLDYAGLRQKFSAQDGWLIDDSVPNYVFLSRKEYDFCKRHRNYRHLGVKDGFLAVYQGPLGFNEVLLQKEDVPIANLPKEIGNALIKVKAYDQLPGQEQKALRDLLEFKNDSGLNAFLDSLDEYDR